MSQFTISSLPVTFCLISFTQIMSCQLLITSPPARWRDANHTVTALEERRQLRKKVSVLFSFFSFSSHPSSPLSLSFSLFLCPVLIFYNTNILIIVLLIRLWPPKSSSSSFSLERSPAFLIKALAGALRCTNGWCGKPQYFQGLSLKQLYLEN